MEKNNGKNFHQTATSRNISETKLLEKKINKKTLGKKTQKKQKPLKKHEGKTFFL